MKTEFCELQIRNNIIRPIVKIMRCNNTNWHLNINNTTHCKQHDKQGKIPKRNNKTRAVEKRNQNSQTTQLQQSNNATRTVKQRN